MFLSDQFFLFYHYTSNLKEITVQDMNEVNEYRKEVILASLLRLLTITGKEKVNSFP